MEISYLHRGILLIQRPQVNRYRQVLHLIFTLSTICHLGKKQTNRKSFTFKRVLQSWESVVQNLINTIKSFTLLFSLERFFTAKFNKKKLESLKHKLWNHTLFKCDKIWSCYHYTWKHHTCLYFWGRLQPKACTLPSSFWTWAFTWRYCSLFCSRREAKLASVLGKNQDWGTSYLCSLESRV